MCWIWPRSKLAELLSNDDPLSPLVSCQQRSKSSFRKLDTKGWRLTSTSPLIVSGWFLGDAHHLRQVVLNLLANAVKFTDTRRSFTPRLHVRRRCGRRKIVCASKSRIPASVSLPTSKRQIFEPFTQADDSITRVYGGTGLGTTIARHLMTQMGGTIGLESTVGVGSAFWIEIPLSPDRTAGTRSI